MAAYAALVSLAQVLDQILHPHQKHYVLAHEKEQIKPLRENIISLLTFLEDNPGEAGKFEARITTAANQVEDIIEYRISYEILSEYGLKHHKQQSLYRKIHKSIKEIDSIMKEVMQIKSSRNKDLRLSHSFGSSSSSSSPWFAPKAKDTVVGFQDDLTEIKGRLCGEPTKLQIIPIVGMGGIGKTTLARYAHDDPLIVHHFYFRAWVTVSQDYHARRILLGLLYYIDASNKEQYEVMSDELLVEHVYRYLKGRRYLIVMDDVWNTNVLDDVRRIFPNDFNGSRVIITTRELDVASYGDSSSHLHQMQLMDVDQSWTLLREKVFGQEYCPPELEKIGKLIAKSCRGLPLAIVVIAGVLSKVNQIQETWNDIARNVNKAVNASDEQFLEILSLSYVHLPHCLRPCFLYMGGFPEDHEIIASKLIKYWAAEGFLKSKDMEEVAEEYLEELSKRNLIMVIKKRSDGKIKVVKIHDLLRDLCLKKARDENFLHVIKKFSSSSRKGIHNSRRLSILSYTSYGLANIYGSATRTILFFHHSAIYSWNSFRLLRVLDAICVILRSYPDGIGELFHLRYLAISLRYISITKYKEFPRFLPKLQNLQTLIVGGFLSLPLGIWRMPKLRHLILSRGYLPASRDQNVLTLENLHTLSGVTGFSCSRRILKMIPNMKKLGIIYSFWDIHETEWSEYCLKNLVHLHKLEKLKLYVETKPHGSLSENIAFPRTLKKLTLRNCRIKWKDMQNIVGSLPNLEVLKLRNYACDGFEWETTEGEFRRLKLLLIDGAGLSHWITESDHFPLLERLHLFDCGKLREIPQGIGEIPTLQLIEVDLNNLSIVESAKCIEEEQRSYGNDDLQVHFLKPRRHYWE